MIQPFKWSKVTPGFRVDRVDGDFTNLANGKTAAVNDYGNIWQPKVGAVITPIDGYSLMEIGAEHFKWQQERLLTKFQQQQQI